MSPELAAATKLIAGRYHGRRGDFAYEAFEWINRELFGDALPWPLIIWGVTPYGRCVGLTQHTDELPVILLHTGLMVGHGPLYALDVLIHECIHVAVSYLLGGRTGETSHNCPEWIAEVNRLAPLLGLGEFHAGANKVKRIDRGLRRVSEATWQGSPAPFATVASFPLAVRRFSGTATEYYRSGALPFTSSYGQELQAARCNTAAAHNQPTGQSL